MNHIKKYLVILIATAGLGLVGCKKFLERPPAGKLEEEKTLIHSDSLMAFLNGCYPTVAGDVLYGGRMWVIKELMADHLYGTLLTEDNGELWRRKTSIFGAYKNDFYREMYQIIYRSNKVLQYLQYADDNKKAKAEGEAKFLRGLMLFEIVRLWAQPYGSTSDNSQAGVPVRLVPDISLLGRSSVKEVYTQILADLNDAANLLPPNNGEYPSKFTAMAALAKVYFQMNDFAKAYEFSNQVMEEAERAGAAFSFDADVMDRWSLGESKEGIFSIKSRQGNIEPGGEIRGRFRSDNNPNPVMKYTPQTRTLFSRPGDLRAAWLIASSSPDYAVLTKYNMNSFDLQIISVTEIKLIRAESAAELGSSEELDVARQDLDDILDRAGLSTDLSGATAALLISTARRERELELIGEGSRLDEIKRIGVRNNQNIDRRGSPYNCNGFILQFPDIEKAGNASFVNNPEGGCF
ncbi:RagB/SusD family nutrient uptake outer membrane protein [Pseudoflavitalea rhizosphaerae]|uniref:RagB/SusD family nutrient uptake outer membrane protein n=1 Tax=Pseudoflavitalea rhizosphaerae TaxID=1884793 RepID=UPI000F8CA052|nr:RagB/SusD family nutrient uptake outer membrane protein [Pseudoflavitalea rhizosphaerae]